VLFVNHNKVGGIIKMIPEKINMGDSLLFMLSCREALAGIVETSSMPTFEKGRTKDFLYNEATDYQIMNLILKGKLPDEKYNLTAEQLLHIEFKDQVIKSANFVSELFGEDLLENLLFEVGPLYPKYSSAAPIVEFLLSSNSKVLTEESVVSKLGGAAEKVGHIRNKLSSFFKGATASKVDAYIARKLSAVKGDTSKAMDAIKGEYEKGKLQSSLTRLNKGRGSQHRAPEGAWDKIRIWAQHKSLDARSAVNNAIQRAQQYSAQNPNAKFIAGAALAALAIFGAYKTYKRFFSKSAKACKGSADRKACIKKFKVDAIKAQISDLQAASARCSVTKDPAKCKATIGNKVQKLQMKAQKKAA
jgi:hypothetical protein